MSYLGILSNLVVDRLEIVLLAVRDLSDHRFEYIAKGMPNLKSLFPLSRFRSLLSNLHSVPKGES